MEKAARGGGGGDASGVGAGVSVGIGKETEQAFVSGVDEGPRLPPDAFVGKNCLPGSVAGGSKRPTGMETRNPTSVPRAARAGEAKLENGEVRTGGAVPSEEPIVEPVAEPGQESVSAGLLWSDFGGAREAGDVDAEETAAREFAEESFGMFNGVRLESDSVARSQVGWWGGVFWCWEMMMCWCCCVFGYATLRNASFD